MVQLIALAYKDQHVGTLQKLLSQWFESSLSESSEDNESNTSPPVSDNSSKNHDCHICNLKAKLNFEFSLLTSKYL